MDPRGLTDEDRDAIAARIDRGRRRVDALVPGKSGTNETTGAVAENSAT